jgi:2-dehydro-3-deoxyphosphogluconate aldolase / (4S)-4-hydroxy-2-oxoglutarate aldolase
MANDIADILKVAPVIPVLTIDRADDAAALARALVQGGLRVLEVTLRTDAAVDAIRNIADNVKDAIVGAGTVLNDQDLTRAKNAGAQFAVSPGLTQSLAGAARVMDIPLLPGIATASDIMEGLELGLANFKFFPAESSGGVAALKAFAGPFPQCRFCPTGGITLENAPGYLSLGNVHCVGGTWIAPRELVNTRDWGAIGSNAQGAAKLRKETTS